MDMLEKHLLVARGSLPSTLYDFDPVVDVHRKKRLVHALCSEGQARGSVGVLKVPHLMWMLMLSLAQPFL